MKFMNKVFRNVKRAVLCQAKEHNEVVYGARAMNKQMLYGYLTRPTRDWDLYTFSPKKSASMLRSSLGDKYYVKKANYPKTYKVRNVGSDGTRGTNDDFTVADYTKRPKKLRTKTICDVKYVTLSEVEKDRKRSLNDPNSKFRHERDREDLGRIRYSKQVRKDLKRGKLL